MGVSTHDAPPNPLSLYTPPPMGESPTFSTTKIARNVEISTFSSLLFSLHIIIGGGGDIPSLPIM